MIRYVHVPKTGGVALREALADRVLCDGHLTTLAAAQEDDLITTTRDPIARYVSAFWWLSTKTPWPWATPDAMACRMGSTLVDNAFERYMVLWRQAHWIDSDRPLLWVGRTESLAEDATRLGTLLDVTVDIGHRNVGRYREASISDRAMANLRDFYAEDFQLRQSRGWDR